MTKRRPSNRKPTGVNASLGSSLAKDRQRARTSHLKTKHSDAEHENVAALDLKVGIASFTSFFFLLFLYFEFW